MIVIAHRGASKEALENSFEAFDLAIEGGSARIELDVRITKDCVPVVMHDKSLERTANSQSMLEELTYAELSKCLLKNNEKIPTLEETLDKFIGRVEFNVELKGGTAEVAKYTSEIVNNFSKKDKIIYSSFDEAPLIYLRDHCADMKRAYLWGDMWMGIKKPFLKDPVLMMSKYDTQIFHPHAQLLTDELMESAKSRDWIVYPWTSLKGIEDSETKRIKLWERLKQLEVHGLCTNYPRELRKWTLRLDS